MLRLTADRSVAVSVPLRTACPLVGVIKPLSIRSVVVLPAPLGPSNP
jgi:hypothetical protein